MYLRLDQPASITKSEEVDPGLGAACFTGTRIPVSVVLDNLADGETAERILGQYPSLRAEHIPAAIAYAAVLAREYPPAIHRGIWLLRPDAQSIERTLSVLRGAIGVLDDEPIASRLWIVEPGRVRIRD